METAKVINLYNKRHGIIYSSSEPKKEEVLSVVKSDISGILRLISLILGLAGGLIIMTTFLSKAYYAIASNGENVNLKAIEETARTSDSGVSQGQKKAYEPAFDSKLPLSPMLYITSIGVSTKILEAPLADYEPALRQGVWRVPDFSTPTDRSKPIILAAHRFGYLKWSIPYRLQNSFYNLPKVKDGDVVKIVWGQRKYTYEVYKTETGDKITDYSADLILYTCQTLDSQTRIFKYARLLEI